jgi:hypothetical protein
MRPSHVELPESIARAAITALSPEIALGSGEPTEYAASRAAELPALRLSID